MPTAAATLPARPAAPPAARSPSPWFRSAPFDLLLILGVPFLTWPLIMLAQDAWGAPLLNQLILLTATGHYFATFVRAYGDRELFERFWPRFVLVPPLLLLLSIGLFTTGRAAPLLLVTMGWAFWHWLAQAFGFARIYDIKVGSYRPRTALLDKALVVTGFVAAVVLNDSSTATFGKVFLDAGIPLPTAAQFAVVQWVVLAAVIVVGAAYLGNLAWTIARGEPWSWQKQFMHATTIGYYWFAFAWLQNVLVAYVLYELFHDVQYFAITWLTCRHRVTRPGVARWLAWMFRPGWIAALGFVALMLALGGIDVAGRQLGESSRGYQLSLAFFLTAALLHYYYDGFIWKARESSLGSDLGIQGGLRATVVPGLRHGARWALFAVPLALVLALGREPFGPRERAEMLVAVAPGDFLSQSDLAMQLATAREMPASIEHYRASIAAHPDLAPTRANFGAALEIAGDLDGAREQYEHALRCRDEGGAHARAHVNLGILLLLRGDRAAAQRHFEQGLQLGGEHPIGRMLALAAALPETDARPAQLWAGVVELDPNEPESRLRLGTMALARRRYDEAARHLGVFAQRAPDHAEGMLGLASALTELGRFDDARSALARVLQRDPRNAQALALQSRLGVR